MKVVINIPEELYETIKKNRYIYEEDVEEVAVSIIGGVPLPSVSDRSTNIAFDVGGHIYGVMGGDKIMAEFEKDLRGEEG